MGPKRVRTGLGPPRFDETELVSRTRCSVFTLRRRAGTHLFFRWHPGPRLSSAPRRKGRRATLRPGHESGELAGNCLLRIACILVVSWALIVPASSQTDLPPGWRPVPKQKGSSVRMDLDGDGKPDQALLATDGHKIKAFAIMAQKQGGRVTELMECGETTSECSLQSLPPGRYVTACGKQLVECSGSPEDPEEIVSKTPLLSMIINENIEVVFLLHGSEVQRVWLTD